jgi:hypothetical protein
MEPSLAGHEALRWDGALPEVSTLPLSIDRTTWIEDAIVHFDIAAATRFWCTMKKQNGGEYGVIPASITDPIDIRPLALGSRLVP